MHIIDQVLKKHFFKSFMLDLLFFLKFYLYVTAIILVRITTIYDLVTIDYTLVEPVV
jgi:hypothetical protein